MIKKEIVRLDEIARITDTIPGFLLRTEGRLLYDLAKNCPVDTKIVEIGSWKGRSTIWLYFGSINGNKAKIFSIDPHTGSPELIKKFGKISTFNAFSKNLKNVGAGKLVFPLVMSSENAAKIINDPVGMVFIDGNHSYQSVKRDFEMWFAKLINNGFILFHDTVGFPDINRLVRKIVFASPHIKVVKIVDSIIYGQKKMRLSVYDTLKNRYILLLHDTCVFFSKHKPPDTLINFGKYILDKIH